MGEKYYKSEEEYIKFKQKALKGNRRFVEKAIIENSGNEEFLNHSFDFAGNTFSLVDILFITNDHESVGLLIKENGMNKLKPQLDDAVKKIFTANNHIGNDVKEMQHKIEKLRKLGANLDSVDEKTGNTLLHYAVKTGDKNLVKYVLEKSKYNDTFTKNINIETPYDFAENEEIIEILENFLENYEKEERDQDFIYKDVFNAIDNGNMEDFLSALRKHPNIDINEMVDKFGNTPLHYALINNNTRIVKILLNKRVDLNKKNKIGKTPLDFFNENKRKLNENIVKEIEDHIEKNKRKRINDFFDKVLNEENLITAINNFNNNNLDVNIFEETNEEGNGLLYITLLKKKCKII